MPASLTRTRRWLPLALYMGVIFYLSSQTHPLPTLTARVSDKVLHSVEYGGLAVLWLRAWLGEGLDWPRAALLALVLTSGYGASDEWHQSFVPSRSADVEDWIADTAGGSFGLGVAWAARRVFRCPAHPGRG